MALDAKLSTLVENQFLAFYKEEGQSFSLSSKRIISI